MGIARSIERARIETIFHAVTPVFDARLARFTLTEGEK